MHIVSGGGTQAGLRLPLQVATWRRIEQASGAGDRERKMGEDLCDLAARHCKPCEGGTPPLPQDQVERHLAELSGWEHRDGAIAKRFEFKNYCQTMAFVNAVAWIAQSEGHHPDLEVSYRSCRVQYSTHAIGGLSENDFISAARVEALFR